MIVIVSTKSSLFDNVALNMLDKNGVPQRTIPLTSCGNTLSGNLIFPQGIYTYQLSGMDRLGTPVAIELNSLEFYAASQEDFSLTITDPEPIPELGYEETLKFNFSIGSKNAYSTRFNFASKTNGFRIEFNPSYVMIESNQIVEVEANVYISSSSVSEDTPYTLEISATNDCITLTTFKMIRIKVMCMLCYYNACMVLRSMSFCIIITATYNQHSPS